MKKVCKGFVVFFTTMLSLVMLSGFLKSEPVNAAKSEQTYHIATDVTFPPFEFANNQNKYVGIDIDLMKAIAKDQGFKVQFKPMAFSGALQAVQSGQQDGMIAGMNITPERAKTFDYSKPYYRSGVTMAVAKNSNINSLKQLSGKKVAVKTGTNGAAYATKMSKKYHFKVTTFDESNDMYQDVITGNSAACFEDQPVMQYAIKTGAKLKTVGKPADVGSYGFAVDKGKNKVLLSKFNKGLDHLKENGEYQKIVNRYLNSENKSNVTDSNSWIGILKQNKNFLLNGFYETVWLSIVSIICATIFGLIVGLLGVLPNKICQEISSIIIYFFRGLPLLVLALFIYTGVPTVIGTKVSAFTAGVITLALDEGAYIAAFVRGGINSVDNGQMEAARSLGLPFSKSMRKVILPQGIKLIVPSFINQFIITLKDTSILSVIGILELTQAGKIIIARNLQGFKVWTIVALIYIIVITILTWLSKIVERRTKL